MIFNFDTQQTLNCMLSLCSLTFVLGAQKKRLIDTVLLNTQNICFGCDYDIVCIQGDWSEVVWGGLGWFGGGLGLTWQVYVIKRF